MVSQFDQRSGRNGVSLKQDSYTWTQTPTSLNPYISQDVAVWNAGQSGSQTSTTSQTLDQYGNVTQKKVYDYTSGSTPIRIYNYTYLSSQAYLSAYIRNRLVTATVTNGTGGNAVTMASNSYDGTAPGPCGGQTAPTYPLGLPVLHDTAYNSVNGVRGNLTQQTTPHGSTCSDYDILGNVYFTKAPHAPGVAVATANATSYSLPSLMTPNSNANLDVSLSYSPSFAPMAFTGPNGETASASYDQFGRVSSSTSIYGATTFYTYSAAGVYPMTQLAVTGTGQSLPLGNPHWTLTTLDGFGRPVSVQTGPGSTPGNAVSETDTVYGPCACSPTGKMIQTSQPYLPGHSPAYPVYWTTYTYDGLGRTLTVTAADGSTSTYSYSGNATAVTDPAGKWKTTATDVQGNIVQVTEPDPANTTSTNCSGTSETGTLYTCYTYDTMEHLTQVTMPRSTGTQTRTFTYDPATQMVASESHPETGTTMYTYGGGVDPTTADLLSYKKDAKGQITAYTYDTYDRVLSIKKYTSQSNFNNSYDDPCQRVAYTYDLYYQGTQTFGAYGRVAMIAMGDPICYATPAAQQQFTEYFNYTAAGQVTQKRLQLYELDGGVASQNYTSYWDVYYTYDAFGQVASTTYPLSGGANTAVTYTVGFDSMQRPNQLSDNRGFYPVGGVQYNPANQPSQTEFQYAAYSPVSYWENRAYNANYQLVSINNFNTSGSTVNGSIQLNYNYTAGANNGQIASMTDNVLGQTVSYSYDALKRLSSATSASGGSTVWSQAYSYDGFGNLTAKTGSGWLFSAYSVNSANNRLAGGSIVYDANGNLTTDQNGATYTYDVANRMVSAVVSGGTETYAYDAENKRISKISASGGQTIYIYGAFGEKLAVAAGGGTAGPQNSVGQGGTGPSSLVSVNNVYFAGRLIKQGADASGHPDYYASVYTNVAVDRLGSVLTPVNGQSTPPASTRYLPFGEELAATGNDVVKFATYTRDGSTGLDYADQRFYTSQFGRFMSADRFRQAAKANDSGSWNKYSYVQNDPISWIDPAGRFRCNPATCGGTSGPETGGSGSGGDGDGGAGGGSSGGTNCTDLRSRTWSPECHDPVEGEGEASPTAPTLVGAAGSLQTLFATAWGGAWNDVGSQKCASDFGKSTSWLQTTLMTANWIYGPITNQDGTASANMASAQVGGNTVTINSLSGFATLQNGTSNWYGNSVNMQATSDQERTFLILHELAHLAGQGASIDANNYNNSFSKAILTDCMGINLK